MKNCVCVGIAFDSVVQPVLNQPSIGLRRNRAWCGGQPSINLAVKSKQVANTRRGALPAQTQSRGRDASAASVKDMEIDPQVLRIGDVFHPCAKIKRGPQVFSGWRAATRRRRKHILLDRRLVDHMNEIQPRNSAVSIPDEILRLYGLGTANIEPVVLAKTAVPGIAAPAELGEIVKPDLKLLRVDRYREVHGLWNQHRYDACGTDAIEQAAVQEFAAG